MGKGNEQQEPATAHLRDGPILRPGRNCWRLERADRFAIIIDGENYFRAVKEAMLQARHSIYLVGWDFDTRIKFEPENERLDGPNKLGAFMRWLIKKRPELNVYVLKWDIGVFQAIGRGTTPLAVLDWLTSRRIRFKLDSAHPLGAVHHQKIAVIDDAIAFCGGIDLTTGRWDTRAHRDHDKRRRRPNRRLYGPWHDATTAVDGPVARALGELARARWQSATGDALEPPPVGERIWPEGLEPTFTDVDVAIARTHPGYDDAKPAREIERLYLDAIASAERAIYCESQYFASRTIAEAIADRLREGDGPEVIIVNPESADGFLEAATMDSARARLLGLLKRADRHDRFRLYTPVTEAGEAIYVHAKILVVDDRLVRVGSSNLNNRSQGFDTECDLAVEAKGQSGQDAAIMRARITAIRNDLLAEHLGTQADAVQRSIDAHGGSLVGGVEALLSDGRSLEVYTPEDPNMLEAELAENDLFDPERPASFTTLLREAVAFDRWYFR